VLKPDISEYEEVGFSLKDMFKSYLFFYFIVFLPLLAAHQETVRPGALLNTWIRENVYGQTTLRNYLASNPLNLPFDDKTPICDYKTMTPKQFYNDYVSKHQPCLFKDYAK